MHNPETNDVINAEVIDTSDTTSKIGNALNPDDTSSSIGNQTVHNDKFDTKMFRGFGRIKTASDLRHEAKVRAKRKKAAKAAKKARKLNRAR